MELLDHKKVKRKNVSNNENLFEALTDERLDTLPEHYQERSPILIEPTQSINIDTIETTKTLHLAASLTDQEKPSFTRFYEEKQINFSRSYADMPRIDPDLIMHHLSIAPGANPVKWKLRKMNPHVSLLVKA